MNPSLKTLVFSAVILMKCEIIANCLSERLWGDLYAPTRSKVPL